MDRLTRAYLGARLANWYSVKVAWGAYCLCQEFRRALCHYFSGGDVAKRHFQRRVPKGDRRFRRLFVPIRDVGVGGRNAQHVHVVDRVLPTFNRFPGRPKVGDSRRRVTFFYRFAYVFRIVRCPLDAANEGVEVSGRSNLSLCRFTMSLVFRFFTGDHSPLTLPCRNVVGKLTNVSIPGGRHFTLVNSNGEVEGVLSVRFFLFGRAVCHFCNVFVSFFNVVLCPSCLQMRLLVFCVCPVRRFTVFERRRNFYYQDALVCNGCSTGRAVEFGGSVFVFSQVRKRSYEYPLCPVHGKREFRKDFRRPHSRQKYQWYMPRPSFRGTSRLR